MPNAAATVLPWKRLPSVSEQMSRSRISRSPAAKADSSIGPARTATARPSLVRVTVSGHGPGMPGSCWSSMTARLSFQGHNRLIFRHQDHDGFPSSRAFRARLRRPPADRSGGAGEDRADPDCAGAGLPRSRHRLPAANPQVRPRAQSTTTGGLSLLIASGATDMQVTNQMGHSKIETTKNIYGHLFAQDRAFILKAMNQAVSRLYVQEDTEGQAA